MTKLANLRAVLMGASALTASAFVMAAAGEASAQNVFVGGPAGSNETRNVGAGQTLSATSVTVGDFGVGNLAVAGGGAVNTNANTVFGDEATGEGTGTVSGAGSSLTVRQWLTVGFSGKGRLTISDGGSATAGAGHGVSIGGGAGQGEVTVTGAGSSLTSAGVIEVGYAGRGELTVSAGATASAATDVLIGELTGSTGAATVTGAGSSLTAGRDLFVGNAGNGRLTVSAGGLASAGRELNIGWRAGGQGAVMVTGAGSSLTTRSLVLGQHGTGVLTVSDGGSVDAASDVLLGTFPAGDGRITVTGAGSSLDAQGWMAVGSHGRGALTVSNGGAVSVGRYLVMGEGIGQGVVNVTGPGSTLSVGGALRIGANARGDVTVANGGSLTATGGIILAENASSTGTLTIGGLSGSAAAGAGTVTGNISFGAGNGLLVFNHDAADHGYTGTITGGANGRIRFESGLTTFNTTGTAFTGASEIRGGAVLNLNGSLGGVMNVLAGGELRGGGTVGVLNLDGTLRIGGANVVGTLNGASADFGAGSVFAVDFSGTPADSLTLTGAANIAPGLFVSFNRFAGAVWRAGDRATFLTAAGGVTGQFTLQNGGPLTAFLGLRDGYTATTAYLEVTRIRDFAAAGLTANQRGAAAGAQSLGAGSVLFNAIANLPNDAAAQVAFDALSGEIHPGVRGVLARDGYRLQQAVIGNAAADDREGGLRVWSEVWASGGRTDSDGNAARLDHDSVGFLAGADVHLGGGWRLGAALGLDEGNLDSRRGDAEISRRSVLAYVDGQLSGWSLKGGLGYTDAGIETRRVAAFASPAGNVNQTLLGDYDGSVTLAYVDVSYPFALGEAQVSPFASLSRVKAETDSFAETGGLAALDVSGAEAELTFTTVGLRAGGVSFAGASLNGSVAWRGASGDRDASGVHAFAGGSDFVVLGAPIARSAAVVDLDAEWRPLPNLSARAGVSFVGSGDESDKGARISLRYRF